MKRLLLMGFLIGPCAWGQTMTFGSDLPTLPSDLPPRVGDFGRIAYVSNAAYICNLRDLSWQSKVEDYAFEAAVWATSEANRGYSSPATKVDLITYMTEAAANGLNYDQSKCGLLTGGALLGEDDMVHSEGIMGN